MASPSLHLPANPAAHPANEPEGQGAAFTLYPPRGRKGLDPTHPAEFVRRLAEFRRHHAALPHARLLGALHVFDLAELRLRFGRRWPEIREKVFQIIEHTLDRVTGAHDLYLVVDETTLWVFTSGRRRSDAKAHMELTASELTARLCGLLPGGVAIRCRTLPFDLVRGLEGVSDVAQLRDRIAHCEREAEAAERQAFAAIADRLVVGYEPLVHPRKRLVAAHRLSACWKDAGGELQPAERLCEERLLGVFDALLDLWLLEQSARPLATSRGGRGILVVPVHAETLLTAAPRRSYTEVCRRFRERSRRHLVFEIVDLPDTLLQPRLRDLAGYLAPFALGIAVRLSGRLPAIRSLEGTGVRFVTVADSEGQKPLADFAAAAHRLRLRAVCLELATPERLREALAAHVDYLAGPAIAPVREAPLPHRRL
ncbi:hypothetical protein HRbin40_00191 [bacterium HR40]|nr:hypothetical protein HRbin40_00191 [bacterium HR40]